MIKRNPQRLVETQQATLGYLLQKIKELEQEIKLYQRVVVTGGGGGGGLTQAVADGQYVNESGDTMTGDLILQADLIIQKNYAPYYGKLIFKKEDGTQQGSICGAHNSVAIMNNAGTGFGNLTCYYFNASYWQTQETLSWIKTRALDSSAILFYARDNDTNLHVECAKLLSASEPEFGISRAGDITQLSSKTSALRASTIGDGGTTNYSAFATDGELNLHGTARVKQTDWATAQSMRGFGGGAGAAAFVDHGVSGAWEFADGVERDVACILKIPNDVDMTGDFEVLLGWSSPAQSLACDWEIHYLLTKVGDDTAGGAQQLLSSFETSHANADGLVVSTFTIDNATQIESGDVCIHMTIRRDGNDGGDTLGNAAHLHGVCFQYIANKLGTAT